MWPQSFKPYMFWGRTNLLATNNSWIKQNKERVTRMFNFLFLRIHYETIRKSWIAWSNLCISVINNNYINEILIVLPSMTLKETKTHISSLLYYNVFMIIENNQWKFEQNRAKNKEVRNLWNPAISRGRYSKWWQVVDNSPYVLYMKFHVFPLFWWLRQFPSLKSIYDKQGCILHCILWSRAMKTCVSIFFF